MSRNRRLNFENNKIGPEYSNLMGVCTWFFKDKKIDDERVKLYGEIVLIWYEYFYNKNDRSN